jgi:CheY-like chemotaxis protein
MKLLLIDDEPHIRQMMRFTLEAGGCEIDEAGTGEEGLARFGSGAGYDAVILDQKMPGLDGLTVLKHIKERAPDARVLMVTAFASIELAVDAMRLGATDFLRKPMTPEALRSAVAAAVAERPASRPTQRAVPGRFPGRPEIETLTLNGFQILRRSEPSPSPSEHLFRVTHFPAGDEFIVTVAIDAEAVERVARLTRRRIEASGSFWRLQAERLLSAFLWSEGKGPERGCLVVRDVSREDLDAAAVWDAD